MRRPAEPPRRCPCCSGAAWERVHTYRQRPEGETSFPVSAGEGYRREIWRCGACGHFVSVHAMDLSGLYEGEYAASTYGGAEGIRRQFERIMGLDPARSDNTGRLERVLEWSARHLASEAPRVLDVGSGLGVFPARLRERTGWPIVALEPDPGLAAHIRGLGSGGPDIEVIDADYGTRELGARFDLITSNKVLEHVEHPLEMLERHRKDLAPGGCVYLELPDGEAASREGFHREEFFIEHHHVFSMDSLERLCRRAGFEILERERLREPSSKYTFRAWLASGGGG